MKLSRLLSEIRREALQVQRECIEDDGTVYPLYACVAMIVRAVRAGGYTVHNDSLVEL